MPVRCRLFALLVAAAFAGLDCAAPSPTPTLASGPFIDDIYAFRGPHGANPKAALIQASDGNLYGTTEAGGASNHGTVFRLTSAGALTTLHSFSGPDGAYPTGALTRASDGNLYGTTYSGGIEGQGTVFRITTAGAFATLHKFRGIDGADPCAGLVQASDGVLYGTTQFGGASRLGTVFAITTRRSLTTLHSFAGGGDGACPYAGLIQAVDGDLYGTTEFGSFLRGDGTVFRIATSGSLTTIHSFTGGSDGRNARGDLICAPDGILYGTTVYGGDADAGTVFSVTSAGSLTTLHSFAPSHGNRKAEGERPVGGLLTAADSDLYGTTYGGGTSGHGTVFRLTKSGDLTTVLSLSGRRGSGAYGALIQSYDGALYGTTAAGDSGAGTVFRVSGVYPRPMLHEVSPISTRARGPELSLTVRGAAFQSFSTIDWNRAPLPTTFVSATILKARVPPSLIAMPGVARITVVTGAAGGASSGKTIKIL